MRTRTLLAGCAVVGVAFATYYGGAQAEAGADQAVGTAHEEAALTALTARGMLQTLPIRVLDQPASEPLVTRDGWDQVRPRPELQRGLSDSERHLAIKELLAAAARQRGLDPGLLMAVAWWESGWDMAKVSDTGAIGIMQIDPATARDLAPRLLGRRADPRQTADNIAIGAAVLAADIQDAGGSVDVALASYYEGGGNVDPSHLDPNAQAYVAGVRALQQQFDAGQEPTQ